MNKLLKSLLLMPLLALSIGACAEKYTEGKQYTKVNETVSSKKEVREYFSVYCGHCFKFEPLMHNLKKVLPEDSAFERNHVDFLRAASPKIQEMVTKATIVAEQLGDADKYIGAIFNYIHVQRAVITSESDLRNLFVTNGADGDKFDKLMKSFSVNAQAKSLKKNQNEMSAKRALTGVPTVIVNGKYKIEAAKLDKDNFEQDYQNLVKYLLELK
ncbi:thiol:disulfide interchange protein DsbA/DsbL [Colwellia sp. E2M01]|uniref:thiol:disulfide interchange protein DsbA/DsbL n=1 Tax=Colwellia sp. E2M01 TaxID=2841561 RepID=UPI001C093D83|nr:thiol:disulfide interchange protein DsbA/DsbL [Colwellia sp. E2M01]MBU2870115.1 thiol:disulfide interchange protein DsbA/DsbL [Colwellia sp. E2M01]